MGHGWNLDFILITACSVGQLCLILCEPFDCSLPGSSVHGIFLKQEYWSGLPFPSSGALPYPGIEPASFASLELQVDSLPAEPSEKSMITEQVIN